MRKLLGFVCLLSLLAGFVLTPVSWAGDASKGAGIFSANCNACHMGGKNVVSAQKTLSKESLAQYLANYDKDPLEAIKYQVTNGKAAMPAFTGRLTAEQIEDVAAYVLSQADKGW